MGVLSGAHRPNTLAAIRECFERAVGRIEIDIHSLAGDDFIVTHDRRLEASTTGSGSVGSVTPDAVRAARFRHDPDDRPPLLSEVAALAHEARTEIQLDLKDWRPMSHERVAALLRAVSPVHDRIIVSSGQDWNLRLLHAADPTLAVGLDPGLYIDCKTEDPSVFLPRAAGAYGYRDDHPLAFGATEEPAAYLDARMTSLVSQLPPAREWFIDYRLVLQMLDDGFDVAAWLRERGIDANVWTLDTHRDGALDAFARLSALGIARVTTNTTPAWERAFATSQA
jgi:glycerophosphoryl diester phosphodiesterase